MSGSLCEWCGDNNGWSSPTRGGYWFDYNMNWYTVYTRNENQSWGNSVNSLGFRIFCNGAVD